VDAGRAGRLHHAVRIRRIRDHHHTDSHVERAEHLLALDRPRVLEDAGAVEREEMFRAFNMGVGMVVITDAPDADRVVEAARAAGVHAWALGQVVPGSGRVLIR